MKKATAQRVRRTGSQAVLVLLLAVGALLGAVAPASAADTTVVKVFVVKDPAQTGGQPDTLASIAAATLNDQNRAAEIFQLNQGQAQPDGTTLNDPNDPLRPGWILRLPQDAAGPDVQEARVAGGPAAPPANTATPADTGTTDVALSLAAILSVVGTVVLALVTAGIVGRRRLGLAFSSVVAAFRRLGDPGRRRRRLAERNSVAQRFATDVDSVRRAYTTLDDFTAGKQRPERPVQALRVDSTGVTAWLSASDTMDAPWQNLDRTQWRKPAAAANWLSGNPGPSSAARSAVAAACLVRVGTDAAGEPIFVDLSRLDGVLSVTGDHQVARDVVQNLLTEISRTRPNTQVLMLRGTDGAPPLAVPAGLNEITRVDESKNPASAPAVRGVVHGGASRRQLKGLVVMAGTPTDRETAELDALCGPNGPGWTGLVCGELGGAAHWRWYTDEQGRVSLPTLGLQLTVPA
jgi:hypothetical protein